MFSHKLHMQTASHWSALVGDYSNLLLTKKVCHIEDSLYSMDIAIVLVKFRYIQKVFLHGIPSFSLVKV